MTDPRAHLVHIVHRLDTGGMENGLVNLVNRLSADRYRHTIVPLTTVGSIARRLDNTEVAIEALGLAPGPLMTALPRLWRLFRRLRPSIVHTRNVGTLEAQIAAWLAGVPVRIHGEHGWEVTDLVGSNASLLRTRRMLKNLVHAQVALSMPTFEYLRDRVGVKTGRLHSICNGVDTERFHPRTNHQADQPAVPIIVGYVGRLADVKNPLLLIEAFERAHAIVAQDDAACAARLRLEFIGAGPLEAAVRERAARSPVGQVISIQGNRDDVPERMRAFDVYALPSLAEGICNTLLEAMASGLPCVVTRVGGNPELVGAQRGGMLVESGDANVFARALAAYILDPALRAAHGGYARKQAVERFGIDRMIEAYDALYGELLVQRHVVHRTTVQRMSRALPGSG